MTGCHMAALGEEPDSKQRRLNLIRAVEGDDWSAVIDSQTQQTIEGMASAFKPCIIHVLGTC